MSGLTGRVEEWRRLGAPAEFRGHHLHTFHRGGAGPLILLLHGFPSSSYDWKPLIELIDERPVLTFDCLGFGLSDKPRDHDYSLLWQADAAEELVRRNAPDQSVLVVGHDMGTSVANELMARDIEAALGFDLAGVVLFNGSMIQGAASPTLGQKLLRGPLGPVAARLSSERFFRSQFGSIFSAEHPLSDEEAADQWALLCFNGGQRLGHRLVRYMNERERRADRWLGAIRDWQGELDLGWALADPVATTNVLDGVRELRPAAPLTEWPDLGHYPQLEDPESVRELLEKALSKAA